MKAFKAKKTKGLGERAPWIAVILASLVFAGIYGLSPTRESTLGYVLAAALVLMYCISRGQRSRRDRNRPDGVLIIAGSQLVAALVTTAPDELRPLIYLSLIHI